MSKRVGEDERQQIERIAALIAVLLNELPDELRLITLQEALHQEGARAEIHDAKLANGTMGESMLAQYYSLTWNKDTVHGADATDNDGRPCELKVGIYRKDIKKQFSLMYVPPDRKPGQKPKEYMKIVRAWASKDTGGHYWGARKGTQIEMKWEVDAARLGDFLAYRVGLDMKKNKDRTKFKYNFGGKPCLSCWRIHKTDETVKYINRGEFKKALEEVPQHCVHPEIVARVEKRLNSQ